MKIQHPLLFKAVGVAGAWLVKHVVGSNRFHFRYKDPLVDPAIARRLGKRYIYVFYHEAMLFPAYYWAWPEMQILISDHRDGELIVRVVQRLGFGVVRGSSTRGGARALREMTHRVDRGHLCVTPDGPKGPRRGVKIGLPYLSSVTGLPVVGIGIGFRKPWRFNSWDKFAIPRPFSEATGVVTEPLTVPPDADRETLEEYRAELERRFQAATAEAEDWVQRV